LTSTLKHIPGLDLLRAIAVLLVLISHWMPEDSSFNMLNNGLMGVTLFFVLSGYLISRILLVQKQRSGTLVSKLKTFYIRRALRIFPIYYLIILLLWFFKDHLTDFNLTSYLLYIQNFWFAKTGSFEWPNAHLWSLAVEEQFYLIWPLLIFLVPNRFLLSTIIMFILIGPLTRWLGYEWLANHGYNADMVHVLVPSTFDCFGLGSLLALLETRGRLDLENKVLLRLVIVLIPLSFIAFVIATKSVYFGVLDRLLFSVFSLLLILPFVLSVGSRHQKIFDNPAIRILLHVGKVSYGVYLFHPYIAALYHRTLGALAIEYGLSWLLLPKVNFIVLTVLTIIISTLSWELIEKPINQLKNRFSY
jgi:peptidoglycan/LPS O-acetylase OafA/YrhL